jgi:phosphoribosyl 1,2-cyclic phosphate phosphodiesterase
MPSRTIQLTVLGSGTSMGVPSLGCHCRVCESRDSHDKRLRSSVLLSRDGRNAVIDTTPDFRQQALRARMDRLDAVVLTHAHADHIQGFDDIRPFTLRQKAEIPVYGTEETFRVLRRAFSYVFDDQPKLSTVPSVSLHVIEGPFELLGVPFVPVPLVHGDMTVLGFRFGSSAYLTDFSSVPQTSLPLLDGLDDLILDALRDEPHPMHQTVEQALALVSRLKPRRAWFTHIAHELAHEETNERLRTKGLSNVQLAYDGLEIQVHTESHKALASSAPKQNARVSSLAVFTSSAGWKSRYKASGRSSVLAIGNFDGIHLGHQAILREAVARAGESGGIATALTFEPPPSRVLRPESAPKRLSTNAQRLEWFRFLDMEAAVVLPFTLDLAKLAPEEFAERILVEDLKVEAVLVGENFRFGHKQAGDAKRLRELGSKMGFEVVVFSPVVYRAEVVSSTAIRREIAAGDVSHAGRLLGRPFALTGDIVAGTGTGSRFTFPTLNLQPEQELWPARGVYITRTLLEGETKSRRSVTNIGMRPTFNGTSLSVETHILNAEANFSAKRMELRFWKRLREEKKFSGPEELRAQISRDIARTNHFFDCLRSIRNHRVAT